MNDIKLDNKYGELYVKVPAMVAHDNAETWTTSYSTETVRIPLKTIIGIMDLLGVQVNLGEEFQKKVGNV